MPLRLTRWTDPREDGDNPLERAALIRDADVLTMVDRALTAGEVMLAFQPVMQARSPGQVAFYEGLVRVLDATGRVIPAAQFMAAAETTELGRKLDCQALHLGLRALQSHQGLRLSINMSARSIAYKPWQKILNSHLRRNPSVGERLILEISEASAMTLPDIVSGFIAEQQEKGICFALDEYGSGLASVKYLKDFYFDAAKIDGPLIRGIHADADLQVTVAALISVARHFDMFTVANLVEDRADADMLTQMGVDCLQGYLYGSPSVRPPWEAKPPSRLFG